MISLEQDPAWAELARADIAAAGLADRVEVRLGAALETMEGCQQLHLDSGVGLDRVGAHCHYINSAMVISAHHFARYAES
jgi:hypothetical protein